VEDSCGLPDRVKGVLRYKSRTSRSVDINSDSTCNADDGKSVIGFGDLPFSYTAFACVSSWIKEGALNRVAPSRTSALTRKTTRGPSG
jgi:hypothetical protein